VKPATAGSTAAAASTTSGGAPQVDALAAKKQARLIELHQTYDLIRAQPFTIAVVLKLNYVPPPPPPVEEHPGTPVEATKSTKAAPGGKGKGKK